MPARHSSSTERGRLILPSIVKLDESYPFSFLKGGADVLVFPDLQSCNIACKLLTQIGGCEAFGPIPSGMAKPVHLLQRAEVEDKFRPLILGAAFRYTLLCHRFFEISPELYPSRRHASRVTPFLLPSRGERIYAMRKWAPLKSVNIVIWARNPSTFWSGPSQKRGLAPAPTIESLRCPRIISNLVEAEVDQARAYS